MSQRDQDKSRQRPVILQTRVSKDEAALVRSQAERAGVSVSALMRYALLNQTPLRKSRAPSVDRQLAAHLLSQLGRIATDLRQAGMAGGGQAFLIEAAQRDLADMRAALFEALGRQP